MKEIQFDKNFVKVGTSIVKAPYKIIGSWFAEALNFIIILMDPNANLSSARFNNLIAYDLNRPTEIKYQVDLPTSSGPDCYTEAQLDGDRFSAFSFSCHRCEIDLKTGAIMSKSFTK